jgi:hypothetical protein
LTRAESNQTKAPVQSIVAKRLIAISTTANNGNRVLIGRVSATISSLWGGGTSVATDIGARLALSLVKSGAILQQALYGLVALQKVSPQCPICCAESSISLGVAIAQQRSGTPVNYLLSITV